MKLVTSLFLMCISIMLMDTGNQYFMLIGLALSAVAAIIIIISCFEYDKLRERVHVLENAMVSAKASRFEMRMKHLSLKEKQADDLNDIVMYVNSLEDHLGIKMYVEKPKDKQYKFKKIK